MSKIIKKELVRKIKALEKFADYADNMLTQLNHALPEPLDTKHWRDEQADHDELMEILDSSKEPKLKQLDQSVFDGLDEKWRFAAVDKNGTACKFTNMPNPQEKHEQFMFDDTVSGNEYEIIANGYDASNWQNSLIERESNELTGSDLCRKMLERGDKYIMCFTSCTSDDSAMLKGLVETVISEAASTRWNFETVDDLVIYAVPINNQGEPLTASEVGL